MPSATDFAKSSKLGRQAGSPIETPAPAKITSWLFRKAVHIGSGNSIPSIFIVKQLSNYPTGPSWESRRVF